MPMSNNRITDVSLDGAIPARTPQTIVEPSDGSESSSNGNHVSPYVESSIIALDVGSTSARFLVHSCMLRKSAPLYAIASKEQPVSLPKLDEGPAHTLIHHLYAGTFERKLRYAPVGKFRHSTCVYCAAVQYQLPSLAELAKDEIVQAGEGLGIFDILRVARDQAFSVLPEDDVWYPQYLEDAIQKAMIKDPEPFRRSDFITRVEGNSRLLQIVWKTVMSSYAAAPTSTTGASGAETPLAESMLTESEAPTRDSLHQLPSPTDSAVNSPPTSRDADDLPEAKTFNLDSPTTSQLEDGSECHPRSSEQVKSNTLSANDDYGLPAIEPVMVESEVFKTVAKPASDIKKPEHVRADSVVEADAAMPDQSFDDAKDVLKERVPAVTNGSHDSAKKGKKKGKKKQSSITF